MVDGLGQQLHSTIMVHLERRAEITAFRRRQKRTYFIADIVIKEFLWAVVLFKCLDKSLFKAKVILGSMFFIMV